MNIIPKADIGGTKRNKRSKPKNIVETGIDKARINIKMGNINIGFVFVVLIFRFWQVFSPCFSAACWAGGAGRRWQHWGLLSIPFWWGQDHPW